MRLGVCQVPYAAHGWLAPQPMLESWKALRAAGVTDLRLQFDLSQIAFDVLFRSWAQLATATGLRVNANVVMGNGPMSEQADATWTRIAAQVIVERFGSMVDSYGIGNEPGDPSLPWMQDDISRDGTRDGIRQQYFPEFVVPVVQGIRAANPNAIITGFEADSPTIQRRCMEAAKENGLRINVETVHPYGDVGGGDYATTSLFKMERHDRVDSHKPWLIGEIDHQQFTTAITRGDKRGVAIDDEIDRLANFARIVQRDYPDCGAIYFGTPEYFFTRTLVPNEMKLLPEGTTWSSWTYGEPVVSAAGKRLAAVFGKPKRRAVGK